MIESKFMRNILEYQLDESNSDQLTGLCNRPTSEKYLNDYVWYSQQHAIPYSVILININDMAFINESKGHHEGDRVIRFLAKKLMECFADIDFIGRFSGDEYILLVSNEPLEEIHKQLQDLLRELANYHVDIYELSFCYGVRAVKPKENVTVKRILLDCDNLMYRWKRLYHLEKMRKKSYHVYRESEHVKQFAYNEKLLLKTLMQSSDDYIYVCDMKHDPTVFRYSESIVKEFGLPGEIVKNAAEIWLQHIHEADREAFLEANQEIVDGRVNHHNVEFRAKNLRGEWVWLRCRGFVERDQDSKPIFFAGFITNLAHKNKIDPLTGLFNKFEFEETIGQITQKEHQESFAIMQLDLDGFANVNKLYDHHVGDQVLAKTAYQIQTLLPQNTKIFRSDGDEFLILFHHFKDNQEIINVFRDIQNVLRCQQEIDGKRYYLTISAGVARFPQDANDLMNITKNTSYALETSKHNGKNCITFFEKEMLQIELRELNLIEQMRYAIEHDFRGFEVYFQPQVDANTGDIIGAEALTRFRCDLYGKVPPLVFIPLLERSGMIIEVGKWIFDTAVLQCSKWMETNHDFRMSINLSYLQLTDRSFVSFISETLTKYHVRSYNVIVEMTESQLMKDDSYLHEIFSNIRKIGIQIAMDDFGTGYSSLGVLKKSPADIVKIDKIFVKGILSSNFDATFIRFVVSLCHDVNIQVLLEGVETKEEYDKVREMGLDYIQGYYFGKPVEAYEFEKLLAT